MQLLPTHGSVCSSNSGIFLLHFSDFTRFGETDGSGYCGTPRSLGIFKETLVLIEVQVAILFGRHKNDSRFDSDCRLIESHLKIFASRMRIAKSLTIIDQ